jgi:hypothetical protein
MLLLTIVLISCMKKITKKCCTICVVDLGLWGKKVQTKCMHHRPQCGGDVYALGLGILKQQAMVGAKAAQRHCCGDERQKFLHKRGF